MYLIIFKLSSGSEAKNLDDRPSAHLLSTMILQTLSIYAEIFTKVVRSSVYARRMNQRF